jgi:isopentenyl-diphosphate delta-isomerase
VGQAGALLKAATLGTDAVIAHVSAWERALQIACFCTASRNLGALQQAPLRQLAREQ